MPNTSNILSPHHPSAPTSLPAPSQPRTPLTPLRLAFTLTEMLVVMSIIIIVAGLSLPAFNLLSGTKSIEGATNIVSAALANARSTALVRGEPVGLAIFYDAQQQRTSLALVGFAQPWTSGTAYTRGDYIRTEENGVVHYWLCTVSHTAGSGATADAVPSGTSTNWYEVTTGGFNLNYNPANNANPDTYVSILPETDVTYLPTGVGAQALNSARIPPATAGNPGTPVDRYLQTSVIFFDADGRLLVGQQWGVMYDTADSVTPPPTNQIRSSRLGLNIQFAKSLSSGPTKPASTYNIDPLDSNATARLSSGLGVVLFDRNAYDNFTLTLDPTQQIDAQLVGNPYGSPTSGISQAANEADREAWLDEHGTLLLLNRYTGTLLRSE